VGGVVVVVVVVIVVVVVVVVIVVVAVVVVVVVVVVSGNFATNYTPSLPRGFKSSGTSLWKPEILNQGPDAR
jgi:hypothetical protein